MNTQEMIKILVSRGMSQNRIAIAVGCTQASVSNWAAGKVEAGGKYFLRLSLLISETSTPTTQEVNQHGH